MRKKKSKNQPRSLKKNVMSAVSMDAPAIVGAAKTEDAVTDAKIVVTGNATAAKGTMDVCAVENVTVNTNIQSKGGYVPVSS